jgi:hypothetical protein
MKSKSNLKSNCCNAGIKTAMSPDFFGDIPDQMHVGTCHYECTKCGKTCDVHTNTRKIWAINPKTRIVPNKKKNQKEKLSKQEIEQIGNA